VRILLTNDDGIFAPGLKALRKELKALGDLTVVAPALEQSGVGHAITLLTPLVVREVDDEDGETLGYQVEGRPADCVKLAILELMPEPPDLIVSGINAGANVGINVLYSGTVAAAIEGAFFQVTSIACSLEMNGSGHADYPLAARQSAQMIRSILDTAPVPGSLFNVNLPAAARGTPAGVKVVPMSIGRHGERFERRTDPRGRTYYWISYAPPYHLEGPETDVSALAEGYITLTPLHFDMTHHPQLARLAEREWPSPGGSPG
jgi:5'-nucleotidase